VLPAVRITKTNTSHTETAFLLLFDLPEPDILVLWRNNQLCWMTKGSRAQMQPTYLSSRISGSAAEVVGSRSRRDIPLASKIFRRKKRGGEA
jgi:hypothetical protein